VVLKNLITLLYSIVDQKVKKHEFGCGFYVRAEFLKYVKEFKIITERKYCLRLDAKWCSCALTNVHAPTNKKMEEVKEKFYNLLEQNTNQINAKVGKESICNPTIGN